MFDDRLVAERREREKNTRREILANLTRAMLITMQYDKLFASFVRNFSNEWREWSECYICELERKMIGG